MQALGDINTHTHTQWRVLMSQKSAHAPAPSYFAHSAQ